jgi:predicted MFS family arabinose efflux permease
VVGEALNRERLVLTQLFVMAVSSSVLCALAFSAQIRVWHIAVGGITAGIVWAMEPAVTSPTPSGSRWTPRWRKADSNPQSRFGKVLI